MQSLYCKLCFIEEICEKKSLNTEKIHIDSFESEYVGMNNFYEEMNCFANSALQSL